MQIHTGIALAAFCCVGIVRSQSFRPVDGLLTEPNQEQGYYSFVKAEDFEHPPKVRKPPYHRSTFRCMERVVDGKLSPKDTLCGDLNKGVIPLNPMAQRPVNDPYPFDLIKNKTLEYLSRSLPFLKEQQNLPKVARFSGPVQVQASSPMGPVYRFRRALKDEAVNTSTIRVNNHGTHDSHNEPRHQLSREAIHRVVNATVNGLCQNAHGTLCTVMSQLQRQRTGSSTMMLNALSGLLNLAKGPQISNKVQTESGGSPSTTANLLNVLSYAGELLNAVNQDTTTPAPVVTRSPLSQVLSALTGANGNSVSNPSPIVQVLDLMTSESSPVKLLANMYSSSNRFKKQSEESTEKVYKGDKYEQSSRSGSNLPPTPCPSMEEYVTPVYARNYQGVWKYVVQIPQEGYLTQTIQQTTCMSQTCDFVDNGLCHESPRWVSLLVAEIFYPDAVVPHSKSVPRPPPHLPPHHPSFVPSKRPNSVYEKSLPGPQPSPSKHYPIYQRPMERPMDRPQAQPPPVEDFHNFQQYLQRRVADSNGFQFQRSKRSVSGEDEDKPAQKKKQKCDGHDRVGCFVVRMYYDWFLVNGSCKCWKPSGKTQAKHIFGGKR